MSRLVVLALLAVLTACTGAGDDQASDHHIVVTTNILGDVVQNIVGDTAEVHVLMKPNADPHSFGVSAQQAAAMTAPAGRRLAGGQDRKAPEPHHGVAVVLSDGTQVRSEGNEDTRTGAVVLDASGAEIARSAECPGIHENGVLAVADGTFTKIASPGEYGRVGTINLMPTPRSGWATSRSTRRPSWSAPSSSR